MAAMNSLSRFHVLVFNIQFVESLEGVLESLDEVVRQILRQVALTHDAEHGFGQFSVAEQ